jgi:glycosyltransferase involved in cell wall biosynthesis
MIEGKKSGIPMVSVLIPAYNRENMIRECIQSARNQTLCDFEIIVCDNASTDQTWKICEEEAAVDPRVRIFRNEENLGPVRNWMKCLEHARGEYAKIVFSDDTMRPDCLQKMVAAIDHSDVGLVYSAARMGSDPSANTILYANNLSRITSNEFTNLILRNEAPVSPGAALMRTSDLRENLKLDFPTRKDWNFAAHGAGPDVMTMLLTASKYDLVIHICEPLVFFRVHDESLTILNAGGQVRSGHTAAICHYLKQHHEDSKWIKRVTKLWKSRLKAERKWIPPVDFLRDFEGTGSCREVVRLWLQAMSFSFMKSLIKIAIARLTPKR